MKSPSCADPARAPPKLVDLTVSCPKSAADTVEASGGHAGHDPAGIVGLSPRPISVHTEEANRSRPPAGLGSRMAPGLVGHWGHGHPATPAPKA